MSPPRRVGPRLASITVGALVLSTLFLGMSTAAETDRLQENADRLAEVRREIEQAEQVVGDQATQLADAERQLDVVVQAVEAASEAVARQQQAVDDANARCEQAAAELVVQRQAAGGLAIERYKLGGDVSLQSMLVADDPDEVLDRSAYLDVIGRADQRTSETLDAAYTLAEAECRRVADEEVRLAEVLESERVIMAEAEAIRDERTLTLAASTEQLTELQAEEDLLASEVREVGTLARRTSREGIEPVQGPGPSADGWCWPSASDNTTSEFGSRWGRLHAGLDIAGPTGTAIFAAQAGRVSFAGRQGGYGNLILVDHGGGVVTAYAHQSRFLADVGDTVACGEQLGEIGSTGNSTGPHLHFEVRVNGTARNPRSYI